MEKIELKILGISSGHSSVSYTLILEEVNGNRKLPIVIGSFEAQAIAIQIENIAPVRPMTHDLFTSMAKSYDIQVTEVVIHKLQEGIFYANIVTECNGKVDVIDARSSDAIAIALRFNCPIYTYPPILEDAGIILTDSEQEELDKESSTHQEGEDIEELMDSEEEEEELDVSLAEDDSLELHSLSALKKLLDKAIEEENYILAAKIRDEIQKREDQ